MNGLITIMAEHGDDLMAFLKLRIDKIKSFGFKGESEYETMWNVAEAEGRRRELQEIINYLDTIWK